MNVTVYFGTAIAAAFIIMYVKQVRPDFAVCITLSAVLVLFTGMIPRIAILISDIKNIAVLDNVQVDYIVPIMKIIGISYLAQISADICKDVGEHALSNGVETFGKVTIALITLPIVEDVFSMIIRILG